MICCTFSNTFELFACFGNTDVRQNLYKIIRMMPPAVLNIIRWTSLLWLIVDWYSSLISFNLEKDLSGTVLIIKVSHLQSNTTTFWESIREISLDQIKYIVVYAETSQSPIQWKRRHFNRLIRWIMEGPFLWGPGTNEPFVPWLIQHWLIHNYCND